MQEQRHTPLRLSKLMELYPSFNQRQLETLLRGSVSPAIVVRKAEKVIFFGKITQAAVRQLKVKVESADPPALLVITSGGGDEAAAIELASLVAAKAMALEIVGECLSACANYVLAAAPSTVMNGVVALHGSPAACVKQSGTVPGKLKNVFLAAVDRERAFVAKYPLLAPLVEISSAQSRGDPSGAFHDWMLVAPGTLARAGLNVAQGPFYEAYEKLFLEVMASDSPLRGSVHVYAPP